MLHGFKPQGGYVLPEWAGQLRNYYWVVRVESRDKSKRRRYYRYIAKEKLRLVEAGVDFNLIRAVCRYLCGFNSAAEKRLAEITNFKEKQLQLDFTVHQHQKP